MAGHSKWANIKHRKGTQDAKKGVLYAKLSRDIQIAAKIAGPDPGGNYRLKTALDKARAIGMPADNIKRAIDKGCGIGAPDNDEAMTYEGYGPGGVAILIETLTNNRNRTAGDIRSYFNKYNGNLGADGCVAWIFEEKGQIAIPFSSVYTEDALLEQALEAGAADFTVSPDDATYLIQTAPDTLNTVCQTLSSAGFPIQSAEVLRIPQNSAPVDTIETAKPLLKLLDALENHDDVQAVHTNAEFDDTLLDTLS